MRSVKVYSVCPSCETRALLLNERGVDPSVGEILARFAGNLVVCENADCQRGYIVRREHLDIRRTDKRVPTTPKGNPAIESC